MMPNEQKKIVFKELLMFSWLRLWVFVILYEILIIIWEFTNFLVSYGMELLTNGAICSVIGIKWT